MGALEIKVKNVPAAQDLKTFRRLGGERVAAAIRNLFSPHIQIRDCKINRPGVSMMPTPARASQQDNDRGRRICPGCRSKRMGPIVDQE